MESNNPFEEKYKVIEEIGDGTFSVVLKVKEIKSGAFYAAKKLNTLFTPEEVLTYTELEAVKKLDYHPNVIGIVDFVYNHVSGNLTLVFELMDMSLYDYIKTRNRTMSEPRVKNLLFQLVKGLHHLHSNGIFHRDIKPENILVKINTGMDHSASKGEIVKLADLGSVSAIQKTPPHSAYISTRWYRAPESLLTAGYYGSKIDIWALGCVFYEMLTLKPLFPGKSEFDQLLKIHKIIGSPSARILTKFKHVHLKFDFPKCTPTSLYSVVQNLSDDGVDILRKTLMYIPSQRISANRLVEHVYFNDCKTYRHSESKYSLGARKVKNSRDSGESAMSRRSCTKHRSLPSVNKSAKIKFIPPSRKDLTAAH